MKVKKSKETHFGLTFIATGEQTAGKYFLSETTVPSGDMGPPNHTHSKEDEGFYIKSGELTFTVEGEQIKLKRGEYLNIEKGEQHTWRNESNSDAELIITFAPAGIEKMFEELEKNMGQINKIGQKYGTDFEIN